MRYDTLAQCLAVYVDSQLESGRNMYDIAQSLYPNVTGEIDVTELVRAHFNHELDFTDFSNSVARSGLANIGEITWQNALEHAVDHPLLHWSSQEDAARDHFRDYGAWSSEEIDEWSRVELNALLIQEAAGALDEADQEFDAFSSDENWDEYAHDPAVSPILRVVSSTGETRYYLYIGI